MANITVSIRERVKNSDGLWCWTPKLTIPEGKLKPTEAQRKGKFYLVWTERGKKHKQKIKEKSFEGAVKAAHAKERHLEDAADGFERPDPLKKKKERMSIRTASKTIHDFGGVLRLPAARPGLHVCCVTKASGCKCRGWIRVQRSADRGLTLGHRD